MKLLITKVWWNGVPLKLVSAKVWLATATVAVGFPSKLSVGMASPALALP